MNTTCPACGVAVVPGYVRCPKCQAPLAARAGRTTKSPGGTSLEERRAFPVLPVLGAVAVLAVVIAIVATRGGERATIASAGEAAAVEDDEVAPAVAAGAAAAASPEAPSEQDGPDPAEAAATLEAALKRQRLWSTVDVIGTRVDVRTSACGDPAMGPTLDGAAAALKAAGVVKLRCLAQSGAVELDRDL